MTPEMMALQQEIESLRQAIESFRQQLQAATDQVTQINMNHEQRIKVLEQATPNLNL